MLLKTTKLTPRNQASNNSSFSDNDFSTTNSFPSIKQNNNSDQQQFLAENSCSTFLNNQSFNGSKLSIFEREKTRETSLLKAISINKIGTTSSNNKQRGTCPIDSEILDAGTFKKEKNHVCFEDKNNKSEFFSDEIKTERAATIIKHNYENTFFENAPPNTPLPHDRYSQSSRSVSPEERQHQQVFVTISDPKKFPPSKLLASSSNSRNKMRFIKKTAYEHPMQLIINNNKEMQTAQPLIKSKPKNSNVNKLEKNFQSKIGDSSVNMIKINNKNVCLLSNIALHNNSNNTNGSPADSINSPKNNHSIIQSSCNQSNEKLFINIYIPNLS